MRNMIKAGLLVLFFVTSCSSKKQTIPQTPVLEPPTLAKPVLGPTLVTQLVTSPRPYLTATTMAYNGVNPSIVEVIDTLFDNHKCTKEDYLTSVAPTAPENFNGYELGKPQLIEVTNQIVFSKLDVQEIADNLPTNVRAYLNNRSDSKSECTDCVQSQIYIEDRLKQKIYELNWKGYLPSRVLGRLLWIGDNVLTFFQSVGPNSDQLIGIDITKKEFIYYAGLSCH